MNPTSYELKNRLLVPEIYSLGDSHSRVYGSPYLGHYTFQVFYMGPITMYRMGRDKPLLSELIEISRQYYSEYLPNSKEKYKYLKFPKKKPHQQATIILVFGEIDIRNNVYKQVYHKNRNIYEILETLVINYVNWVLMLKIENPEMNFIIQNVIAPTDERHIKDEIKDYPVVGSFEERSFATKIINQYLSTYCNEHKIQVLNVYDYFKNDDNIYPISGINNKCDLDALDIRIKDTNVHIDPVHANLLGNLLLESKVTSNVYVPPKGYCKYPSHFNYWQQQIYKQSRIIHYLTVIMLIITPFIPTKYINVGCIPFLLVLSINVILFSQRCFLAKYEYTLSDCNNRSVTDFISGTVIVRNEKYIVVCWYLGTLIVVLFKLYKNNK